MSSLMADYSGGGDGAPDNPRRPPRAVRPRRAADRGRGGAERPRASPPPDRRPAPVVAVDARRAGPPGRAARAEAERPLPGDDADARGPPRPVGREPAGAHPDRVVRLRPDGVAAAAGEAHRALQRRGGRRARAGDREWRRVRAGAGARARAPGALVAAWDVSRRGRARDRLRAA